MLKIWHFSNRKTLSLRIFKFSNFQIKTAAGYCFNFPDKEFMLITL